MTVMDGAKKFMTQLNTKKILLALVVGVISFIFSPGLLLTLPPSGYPDDEKNASIINSFKTNLWAMIAHAVVISSILYIILSVQIFYDTLGIRII